MLLFNHLPVIINLFIHPEEVTTTDRGEKDFSILTIFNTTRVKQVHLISKTIFCFAGLWFDEKKFCFHWITKAGLINPDRVILHGFWNLSSAYTARFPSSVLLPPMVGQNSPSPCGLCPSRGVYHAYPLDDP